MFFNYGDFPHFSHGGHDWEIYSELLAKCPEDEKTQIREDLSKLSKDPKDAFNQVVFFNELKKLDTLIERLEEFRPLLDRFHFGVMNAFWILMDIEEPEERKDLIQKTLDAIKENGSTEGTDCEELLKDIQTMNESKIISFAKPLIQMFNPKQRKKILQNIKSIPEEERTDENLHQFIEQIKEDPQLIEAREIYHLELAGKTFHERMETIRQLLGKSFSVLEIGKLQYLNYSFKEIGKLSNEEIAKCVQIGTHIGYTCSLITIKDTEALKRALALKDDNIPHFLYLATTGMTVQEEEELNADIEDNPAIWSIYELQVEDWTRERYGSASRGAFGQWMDRGTRIGSKGILEKGWGFFEVLSCLAYQRNQAAYHLRHIDPEGFGYLRRDIHKSFSYCEEVYADLQNFFNKLRETQKDPYHCHSIQLIAFIEGEEIKHSKIIFSQPNHAGEPKKVRVEHTVSPIIRKKILNHCAKLYQLAINEKDSEKRLEILGQIFWWICQAKPWSRGDPSIVEMIVRAVWLSKTGENLPGWQRGMVPWMEVMKEPDPEKFGKHFKELFRF